MLFFRTLFKFFLFITPLAVTASFSANALGHREDLSQAYLSMLDSNPQFSESQASQQVAWQAYKQLQGGFFPTVALSYNAGRGKGIQFSPQTTSIGYNTSNIQHKGIILSQLLFDGGALSNRVASAKTQFDAAQQQMLLQKNQLALKTASVYLNVLRSEEIERIARQNLHRHSYRLQQEQDRYRAGVGTASEFALANTRLEQAEIDLNKAKLETENAKAAYREVIGHYPAALIDPVEPRSELLTSLTKLEQIAEGANPAIISAQNSTRAAQHEFNASRAVVFVPNVSLQLAATRDNNTGGVPQRNISMAGYVAVTYNLFNGGADYAAMRKNAEQINVYRDRLEAKRREVALAIEQTWNELKILRRDIIILKQRINTSAEVVDNFDKEMQLGKRTLLDLLDTENELNKVRMELVDAKYKAKINTYTLLANAGLLSSYLDNTINGTHHA